METQEVVNTSFCALLDAQQAAALLGCHPKTLLRKAREGIIPSFQIFGKVRFTEPALAEWVARQSTKLRMAA